MKIDLSGRVSVVTGGTAGIGLAAVRLFLEAGAAVAFCGRDKDTSADVAEVLVRDPSNVKAIFRRAQARASLQEWSGAVADLGRVLELQPGNKLAARDLATAQQALAKQTAPDGAEAAAHSDALHVSDVTIDAGATSPGKKLDIIEVDQTSSSDDDNGEDEATLHAVSPESSLVRKLAEIDVSSSLTINGLLHIETSRHVYTDVCDSGLCNCRLRKTSY